MECIWNGVVLSSDQKNCLQFPDEIKKQFLHVSNSEYLGILASLVLDSRWTTVIFTAYEPIFVEICNRLILGLVPEVDSLRVVAALARVLPSAPYLSIYAERILHRHENNVASIFFSGGSIHLSGLTAADLMARLLTLTRLLEFDNEAFAPAVSPAQVQLLLGNTQPAVRYLAIRVLCLYLHAADSVFLEMVRKFIKNEQSDGHILGPWEDKEIDYAFYGLWEQKRLRDLESALSQSRRTRMPLEGARPSQRIITSQDLLPSTIEIAGVLLPGGRNAEQKLMSLIMTSSTVRNLDRVAEALKKHRSILVTGLPGSGKSSIVKSIAKTLGQDSKMLTLHLNEQTDVKLLIGIYTSGRKPGSFEWVPGVLTTAVREGRWVLIEDLDRAPKEVLSTILPLLDRGELLVPNLGGFIYASREFKLIATISSRLNSMQEEVLPSMNFLGARNWHRVSLERLSEPDLQEIVDRNHPILHAHQNMIMGIYRRLTPSNFNHSSLGTAQQLGRFVGPKELFRYCRRLQSLLLNSGVSHGSEPITESFRDNIFLEAIDCFAIGTQTGEMKSTVVDVTAQEMGIPLERALYCLYVRTPSYLSTDSSLCLGRATLKKRVDSRSLKRRIDRRPFALTNQALRMCESVAMAVQMKEPCLLVGETGIGKTTIVQEIADSLGHNLVVVNLSRQSEAGDLLGGYKPVNLRILALPMKEEFDEIFEDTFSSDKNKRYLKSLGRAFASNEWNRVSTLWQEALKMVETTFGPVTPLSPDEDEQRSKKRRRLDTPKYQKLKLRWDKFANGVNAFQKQLNSGSKGFAFSFNEGKIVTAVKSGDWILLDEINLASPDTLESLADLLADGVNEEPYLLLSDIGNAERIVAHPEFRIFGAMNPATDVGKRDLPPSLRSRFTEHYMESPDRDLTSLIQVVTAYLGSHIHTDLRASHDIATLYLSIKRLEDSNQLVDGAGQKPHFSLRTLARTIVYSTDIGTIYGLRRALFEGFQMSFLTLLNRESELLVLPLIEQHLLGTQKNARSILNQIPRAPTNKNHVRFKHYWIVKGPLPVVEQPEYIITPFVERNLMNLVRATSTRRFPVLLQGPTSSGKTSMIEYLAKLSGNKFVRINNHEHTDLQEYLGTYISGSEGQLQYQEGVLVKALREGSWIVLDELNLAPSDILEALNRLLDDNRELFIPETQEVVRPHENFMLFATQNPPGLYGGRKVLSRAFRNRFLELHFDDIPEDELETILRERTQIAPSFCSKIVTVYKKLAVLRQSSRLFEQSQSFATLRDLFRWALRDADDREELAINGYMLLGERVRNEKERLAVKMIIEEVMKVQIDPRKLYNSAKLSILGTLPNGKPSLNMVWTQSMRRLLVLILKALKYKEPVLLVGNTGCGKTMICQVIAEFFGTQLHIVNAHQNTETGDLIGAQRPIRNKASIESQLLQNLHTLFKNSTAKQRNWTDLSSLIQEYNSMPKDDLDDFQLRLCQKIDHSIIASKSLFEWSDGSLVCAMKSGHHFLLDEISLADDSVLERLNSVLEPARTILLAEKGSADDTVVASKDFQFLATMNPGGDYGKKELSPALRNRFTEIWVPPLSGEEDIFEIATAKLTPSMRNFARPIVHFSTWYSTQYNEVASDVSIRDILAWIQFVNKLHDGNPYLGLFHGAAMVYIDGLGANPTSKISISPDMSVRERQKCVQKLSELFKHDMQAIYLTHLDIINEQTYLEIGSFRLEKLAETIPTTNFSLSAPTTATNAMRIIRALQLTKPILIEGSPGVGKTTLIAALAHSVSMPLTRINLSEQTDITDLFGSDTPIDGGNVGQFSWRDGPFLKAMQKGEWILLDEMNLASQSILEGLNACLDHRGQVYIPELDQTFSRHPSFVVFATQNPHHQGGGRKGLPASFVNRFTVVYADLLNVDDLFVICRELYPKFPADTTRTIIQSVVKVGTVQRTTSKAIQGSSWEFNLRDILRWLHLLNSEELLMPLGNPANYFDIIFLQRFRNPEEVIAASRLLPSLPESPNSCQKYFYNLTPQSYQVGLGLLERHQVTRTHRIGFSNAAVELPLQESILLCLQHRWPCLLVGPSGSGKSSLIRHIAGKAGADITELPLNSDMDTMDLIGGYEQIDIQRHILEFKMLLREVIENVVVNSLTSSFATEDVIPLLDDLKTEDQQDLQTLGNIFHRCKSIQALQGFSDLEKQYNKLIEDADKDSGCRFEWVDGTLIKALERGQWLVLDNANLCNPSVLDRLNALMEPGGVFTINEFHSSDELRSVVKPHPNFRLFLTMDPQNGELSRAMRNRCVELFLPLKQTLQVSSAPSFGHESSLSRFQSFSSIDWYSLDTNCIEALAFVCLDHLSFSDLPSIESYHGQGLLGGRPQELSSVLLTISTYIKVIGQESRFLNLLNQLYESVVEKRSLPKELINAQTIHPLNNPVLIPDFFKYQVYDRVSWLAKYYEIKLGLAITEQRLVEIQNGLAKKPTAHMSRLERSMASNQSLALSKDSTRPVSEFLAVIMQSLSEAVDVKQLDNTTILDTARKMHSYAQDLIEVTSLKFFDEAAFQAFLSQGREMANKLRRADGSNTNLGQTLATQLDAFRQSWSLSTGQSMERLWKLFKPQTAANLEQLDIILKFEELADRFNQLAWRSKATVYTLAKLRRSIVEAYANVDVTQDVALEIFKDLEDALADVEVNIDASTIERNLFLRDEFVMLRQYTLQSTNAAERLTVLDLLCGVASTDALHLKNGSATSDILVNVARLTDAVRPISSLATVREVLPISIINKMIRASEVRLCEVDLFRQEFGILVESIFGIFGQILENKFEKLHKNLATLQNLTYQAHREFFRSYSFVGDPQSMEEHSLATLDKPIIPLLLVNEPFGTPSNHQFNSVFDTYLKPSSHLLHKAMQGKQGQLQSTATAWINYFIGALLLYVPDRPMDPATRPLVKRSCHNNREKELQVKLNALQMFETYTGQTTALRRDLVERDLKELGVAPQVPPIARPQHSELGQLQGEFTSVLDSIVHPSTMLKGDITTIHNIRTNILQAIRRLSCNYRAYDDINKPLIGLLRGLDAGLGLRLLVNCEPQPREDMIMSHYSLTPLMGYKAKNPTSISAKDLQAKGFGGERILYAYLGLVTLKLRSGIELDKEAKDTTLRTFHSLYEEWKRKLTADQTNNAEKSSLYRYRGGQEEDEQDDRQEFLDIFPEFDDFQAKTTQGSSQASARDLAKHHHDLFRGKQKPADQVLYMLESASKAIATLWKDDQANSIFPIAAKEMMPNVILTLSSSSREVLHPPLTNHEYNFYVDANHIEAHKILLLTHKIRTRFAEIQSAWPEHATLGDVIRTSDELLAFRHVEPLAKIITKAEQLHGYIHEWQVVASREYTAVGVYDELTELIVSWRRLELSTWSRLLDIEDQKCKEDAKSWWYIAYENMIAVPLSILSDGKDLSNYVEDLTKTLIEFFHTTIVGQYTERLTLLGQFKDHLQFFMNIEPRLSVVHSSLANLLDFYSRYEQKIQDTLHTGRLKLEKDMKEIILLASWKDTNINALCDSAKRSHHKLFKVIRKYRVLLSGPSESVLIQGLPEKVYTSGLISPPRKVIDVSLDPLAVQICENALPSWEARPARLKNTDSTAKNMLYTSQLRASAIDCSLYIDSFSTNLVDTISVLRKETPPVLTKENKEIVKHLKSRKRKLFADTLKDLRKMGFKSNLGAGALDKQSSLSAILASTPALSDACNGTLSGLPKIDFDFHKTLNNMATVRESAREHSDELTSNEVNRSMGYLESILATILKQRGVLATALTSLESFDENLKIMQNAWGEGKYEYQIADRRDSVVQESALEAVRWLPGIIDALGTLVTKLIEMKDVGRAKSVLDILKRWKEECTDTIQAIDNLPNMPPGLSTSLHLELCQRAKDLLEQLALELVSTKSDYPEVSFLLRKLEPWLASQKRSQSHTNSSLSITISQFDQKLSISLDSILVGVQRMHETLSTIPTSAEDSTWLSSSDGVFAKALKAVQIDVISESIHNILSQFQHLKPADHSELRLAAADCAMALPIIQQYRDMFEASTNRYLELHASTCRMARALTGSFKELVSKGFCSPQEKLSADDGKAEKLEAGTGLGEGEGAEDISKDVQDDEDLSELAQEQNKKDGDEKMEDVNDAVDMQEEDMEGRLGDTADKGEDSESDGEEQDGEDAEEEVGGVDDLDPSAVDEKLWDGKADDAQKEKEADKANGKKDGEMTAQDEAKAELRDDDHSEGEEADELGADESDEVQKEQVEKMDPRLKEEEHLDLPDEMELDGDKRSEVDSDNDMEDASDLDQDETASEQPDAEVQDPSEHLAEETLEPEDPDQIDAQEEANQKEADTSGSPIDTEPSDDGEEDHGLLEAQTEDFGGENDNSTSDELQDIARGVEQPNETKNTRNDPAQSNTGAEGEPADNNDTEAAKRNGRIETERGAAGEDSEPQESKESQAFKKLGDALEKWHRQHRQIREPTEQEKPDEATPMDLYNPSQEFEHLPDEDAEADTQALGAAMDDQVHGLDKRALDSEMIYHDEGNDEDEGSDVGMDDDEEQIPDLPAHAAADLPEQSRPGATIGSENRQSQPHQPNGEAPSTEEDISDLDNDLSTIHIRPPSPSPQRSLEEARRLWSHYDTLTHPISLSLSESLRLILAPTLATKLRGDFRTGKRLNIRKIIPYIASQYKRDKIWMRRSVPSKRAYQIMLAVDDSKSMGEGEGGAGQLAFETLALISKALNMLEVGQLCVVGFGDSVSVLHAFEDPWSPEAGTRVFQGLGFHQDHTNVRGLLSDSLNLFRDARAQVSAHAATDLWQLQLIISDGICEDHASIKRLVRQAQEERIMIIFVIVDALKGESIMDMTQAIFEPDASSGETKLKIRRYLEDFPFGYYLIVGNVRELPGVLAQALRQWFAEVVDRG